MDGFSSTMVQTSPERPQLLRWTTIEEVWRIRVGGNSSRCDAGSTIWRLGNLARACKFNVAIDNADNSEVGKVLHRKGNRWESQIWHSSVANHCRLVLSIGCTNGKSISLSLICISKVSLSNYIFWFVWPHSATKTPFKLTHKNGADLNRAC